MLERLETLGLMDDGFVRQLVVPLRGFNELPPEVEDSGVAHLRGRVTHHTMGLCGFWRRKWDGQFRSRLMNQPSDFFKIGLQKKIHIRFESVCTRRHRLASGMRIFYRPPPPTHLVMYLQLLIGGLVLEQRGSVDVGLGLHRVVVLQVETGYFQVGVQLVVDIVLPRRDRVRTLKRR